jgi:two-component system NarL family response regulator
MGKIRIAVVDDHEVVRVGLRLSLEAEPDMQVVGEGSCGETAVALARDTHPDVMMLDAKLDDCRMGAPEACRAVLAASPKTAVLVLTNHRQDAAALRDQIAGAKGYLAKGVNLAEMKRMVRAVHLGAQLADPQATVTPMAPAPIAAPAATFGELDLTIIKLLTQGMSNKQIGARVHLSPYTIKDHLKKIASMFSVRSRTEIVAQALRRGIV